MAKLNTFKCFILGCTGKLAEGEEMPLNNRISLSIGLTYMRFILHSCQSHKVQLRCCKIEEVSPLSV